VIVCSCHAVSDRSLRQALADGLSPEEAVASTRAGSTCGRCLEAVAGIVGAGAGGSREGQGGCAGSCDGCPGRGSA